MTHRVDGLDQLFVLLSWLGVFGGVWIALAAVASLHLRRPGFVLFVAGTVLAADLVALALKHLGGRARPYVGRPDPEPLMTTQFDLSFPSGHAATSFAGATLLALALPRFAAPLLVLAAGIAWSRVYVGVHFPLDVAAGAVLGAGIALLATALLRLRAIRRG